MKRLWFDVVKCSGRMGLMLLLPDAHYQCQPFSCIGRSADVVSAVTELIQLKNNPVK